MKYLSLDIETTGIDPQQDQILMLSMVVEDSSVAVPVEELPHFTCFIKHERIQGNAFALAMNGWILDIISGRTSAPKYPVCTNYDYHEIIPGPARTNFSENYYWLPQALEFLTEHFGDERITVAGKNVAGFDIPFLPKNLKDRFRHRVIDPGTLFIDWNLDRAPSDLAECKKRANIHTPVAHDAREDAMDVIRILRSRYHDSY